MQCELHYCPAAVDSLAGRLRADPYIGENYHQKLMTGLSVTEGQYTATEHDRRLVRFLRDDLNDTPMPGTRSLAERLKCGEHICDRSLGRRASGAHVCPFSSDGRCPLR